MHLKCYSKKNYARKSYQIIKFNRFFHIIKSKENFPKKKKKKLKKKKLYSICFRLINYVFYTTCI